MCPDLWLKHRPTPQQQQQRSYLPPPWSPAGSPWRPTGPLAPAGCSSSGRSCWPRWTARRRCLLHGGLEGGTRRHIVTKGLSSPTTWRHCQEQCVVVFLKTHAVAGLALFMLNGWVRLRLGFVLIVTSIYCLGPYMWKTNAQKFRSEIHETYKSTLHDIVTKQC